jgi:hypothetical protein
VLGGEPQRRPAGGQYPQARCCRKQLPYERRRVQQLLEVVQDDKHSTRTEVLAQLRLGNVQRLRDGGREEVGPRDRRERDEEGAVT